MAKTIELDFDYPEYSQDNTYTHDCKSVSEIKVLYDGDIDDNFTAVSYSGSTLSINVCGNTSRYNFTNIKDPSSIKISVTRHDDSNIFPGQVQFNNSVSEFLNHFDVPPIDDRGSTINIDMNYGMTANVMNYNCKNVDTINVTFDSEIEDMYVIHKSGSTVSLNVTDAYKYNFKNISSLEDVKFKVTRSAGSVIAPGEVQFDSTLKELCDAFETWLPEKGTKVDGSVFDDNIAFAGYEGTKGLTINANKGDDVIDGTEFNDTITGGEGVNTINLFTKEDFGDDVVVLTKGEHLLLKIADLDVLNGYSKYSNVYLNGDNLVVDVYDGEIIRAIDEHGDYVPTNLDQLHKTGSVTIKNYAKKDVLTVTGDLFLTDNNDYSNARDLRSFQKIVKMDSDHYTKANYTGGWLDDSVDATNFKVYKKGQEVTTNTEGYEKVKGVTVNTGGAVNSNLARGSIYADTLNGGANDDRLYGAKGNDKLVGGAGNDTISGGAGNDTLTGGKDNDTFTFYKSSTYTTTDAGVDTITDAAKGDIIRIVDVAKEDLSYVKNGNDLEIYYDNTLAFDQNNKIIVKNHFKTKEANRIEILKDKNGAEVNLATDINLVISGKGKINGTDNAEIILGSDKADTIKALGGDDTINAGAGNDKIYGDAGNDVIAAGDGNDNVYGGAGDDLINAGAGKNNIYYSLDDGDDTIFAGGGTDTLVFDKGIAVTAEESGSDVIITYSGTKKGVEYSNTITIDNYATTSVGYAKVNGKTVTIDDLLNGGGGTTKNYEVNDTHLYDDPQHPLTLSKGYNNKVVFSGTYDDCYITSNNTSANTDTLQISNFDMTDSYSLGNFQYNYYDATLNIDTTPNGGEGGGLIMYTATNTPKIAIADSERKYNFNGYTSVQGTEQNPLALADGNNLLYIKATEGTSYVTSNDDYNVIKTGGLNLEHGAGLDYTYGGGYDVIATASSSNDVYNVAIGSDTSAVVYDCDGADTINVTGDNIRMVYDSGTSTVFKTQCIFMDKDVLSDMTTEEFKNILSTNKGLNIAEMNINDADTINVNGTEVTMDNWSVDTHNVHQAVAAWLTDNAGYNTVSDALEQCTDDALLASLKGCFVTGTYESPNA